jgi:hypothetical protein
MRFLSPTRPVLYFWRKSFASTYQLTSDTFCTGRTFSIAVQDLSTHVNPPAVFSLLAESICMSWIKSLVQQTSLPDQEPSPLVVVQRKLLDGYGLSDRALRPSRDINRGCA